MPTHDLAIDNSTLMAINADLETVNDALRLRNADLDRVVQGLRKEAYALRLDLGEATRRIHEREQLIERLRGALALAGGMREVGEGLAEVREGLSDAIA